MILLFYFKRSPKILQIWEILFQVSRQVSKKKALKMMKKREKNVLEEGVVRPQVCCCTA